MPLERSAESLFCSGPKRGRKKIGGSCNPPVLQLMNISVFVPHFAEMHFELSIEWPGHGVTIKVRRSVRRMSESNILWEFLLD